MPLHVSSTRAHRQEVKIVLYSLWYHHTCRWPSGAQIERGLQARSGPEGSRKLRFPHFMTTAQDGGKVVSLTHRPPLPPGNVPGTQFC